MAVRAEDFREIEPAASEALPDAAMGLHDKVIGINGLPLELAQSDVLSRVEILGIREGGYVECFVPFNVIDNEEVPVKEEWALSLAQQMGDIAEKEGGTGQHMPVTLGFIPGESDLKIMDGFHRSAALRLRGEEKVYATVKLTDWDHLYDFRIFTAKDHTHVRFSRVVQWIQEVWDKSPLSQIETGNDKTLAVSQAMVMYGFGSEGSRFDMKPEEAEAVKDWVARKEHLWALDAMTIYQYLKVAETVDPGLVHSTREKRRSDILEAPTQRIIAIFAKELPNNFALQNLVMDTAKSVRLESGKGPRSLTGPEIRTLCLKVKDCETIEEAQDILNAIDWNTFEPEYGETKQRALRRAHDPRHKGAAALAQTIKEIGTVRDRVALIKERDEEVNETHKRMLAEARDKAIEAIGDLGALVCALSELLGEPVPNKAIAQRQVSPQPARPVTAEAIASSDIARRRAQQEVDGDEGLLPLMGNRFEQQSMTERIQASVWNYLAGEADIMSVSVPMTRSEKRVFKSAMQKAFDMDEEKRAEDWDERFRDLQIMAL